MSIRQKLNRNPAMSVVLVILLVAVAAAILWYTMQTKEYTVPDKTFYTVDDGQTLFVDSMSKVTPFDYEGKQAVRAYVYTCDGGKSQFVAYLERMPDGATVPQAPKPSQPIAKPQATDQAAAPEGAQRSVGGPTGSTPPPNAGKFTTLVRKPGQKDWIKPGDPRYFPTIAVSCPSTSSGPLDRVNP